MNAVWWSKGRVVSDQDNYTPTVANETLSKQSLLSPLITFQDAITRNFYVNTYFIP